MKKSDTTLKKYLSDKLSETGIIFNPNQLHQLWKYHSHLRNKNEELNLTRIHNFENIVRKQYIDCLIILNIFKKNNLPFPDSLLDLGSGPGLPGIPLSIALPDHKFILSEGRKQRVDFLNETIQLLDLKNAEVFGKNIQSRTEIEVDAVITRAVEEMEKTALRCSGILKPGSLLIFMKGPNCSEEITNVIELKNPECKLLLDEHYVLPESADERRLIVFQIERNLINELRNDSKYTINQISSEENKIFKIIKTLNTGKMIKKHGQSLFCGKKIMQELIYSNYRDLISSIIITEKNRESFFQHMEIPESMKFNLQVLPQELFNQVDFYGCRDALMLINLPEIPDWIEEKSGITVFLPLSDPENLGAAFRSCAAFDFQNIVLLNEAAHPFHGKCIRSSAGELFHLSLQKGPSINQLKSKMPIFALDPEGEPIDEVEWPENFGLLTGMEGQGIPIKNDFKKIKIPVSKNIESLNASVALGIALFEIRKSIQRRRT
ncbi:MAG: 16S rRNA (guanine(527)-N(7))-methyltransferase RsmG [Spirochaetia bacterium]|nr:16S rRNA (guanine(527)-N(7))-methyltransferase RsmG [Spirochaetia bacterium]